MFNIYCIGIGKDRIVWLIQIIIKIIIIIIIIIIIMIIMIVDVKMLINNKQRM